jgi:P-type conjugative transfer protein TrbG
MRPQPRPCRPHYSTNLIVVTNRRTYHMTLVSGSHYMEQATFYFPAEIRAQQQARREALRKAAAEAVSVPPSKPLNFNYAISGPDVPWKPTVAFDDGSHMYIQMPENTAGWDAPTLMSEQGKQQSLVNYEVRNSTYVVDRMLQSAVLTSGVGTNRQVVRIVER